VILRHIEHLVNVDDKKTWYKNSIHACKYNRTLVAGAQEVYISISQLIEN